MVQRCHRRQDQDQQQCGDIDRLGIDRHVKELGKCTVREPAGGGNQQPGKRQRCRIMRHQLEETQSKGDGQHCCRVIKHQPIHGDAVEPVINDIIHDVT